jgi:hypothetical protein
VLLSELDAEARRSSPPNVIDSCGALRARSVLNSSKNSGERQKDDDSRRGLAGMSMGMSINESFMRIMRPDLQSRLAAQLGIETEEANKPVDTPAAARNRSGPAGQLDLTSVSGSWMRVPLVDAIQNLARQAELNFMFDPHVSSCWFGPRGIHQNRPSIPPAATGYGHNSQCRRRASDAP